MIRSALDYGCLVYGNAAKTNLPKLDVVQAKALRVCCGAGSPGGDRGNAPSETAGKVSPPICDKVSGAEKCSNAQPAGNAQEEEDTASPEIEGGTEQDLS